MLAGLIASPGLLQPGAEPRRSLERRNLVLQRMYDQGLITSSELRDAQRQTLPPRNQIRTPKKVSRSPYFTSWVEDQLVDRYGSGNTFGGGLKIRTTLDLDFQKAAERRSPAGWAASGPSAALVAIDNDTGGVRAMVGGLRLPAAAVQPRDPGPPPARIGIQALHPDRRARAGHLPRPHVHIGAKTLAGAARPVQGRELRGPLRGGDDARRRPRPRPTTPSTRRSATSSSAPARSRTSRARWACARRSRGTPRWCSEG